jgi:large-conductance mechanosensitive channel
MKPFLMLRAVLLIVAAAYLYVAYLFFVTPESISALLQLPPSDNVHQFLTMNLGALFSVFGLGALLAFARPIKYATIIIMLLLSHFMMFLIDVIVLARGQMPWNAVLPEMVYFLIVSTALVRFYPLAKKPESKPTKENKKDTPKEPRPAEEEAVLMNELL